MSKAWSGGSDTRWRRFRLTILERDRWRCKIRSAGCKTLADCVDHIVPLSKGGPKYDPGNARAACTPCNTRRGDRAPAPQPAPRPVSSW